MPPQDSSPSSRQRQAQGRIFLGAWSFPSGNSMDVFTSRDDQGLHHIWHEWDTFPPSHADQDHYETVVRPQVIAQCQQYWERPGPTVVIELSDALAQNTVRDVGK
jgi:hypothetical protein